MRKTLLSLVALVSISTFAQEKQEQKNGWTKGGTASLLFNQSAFNKEWTAGGTNNYGGNLSVSYDVNYKKDTWTWDNKILFDYGLTKVDGDDFTKKTNDRLSLTSLVGKEASNNWYYSFFLNFQTQIAKGYEYPSANVRIAKTDFMAPGYLSFGPGLLWKKNDNLKVNIAPVTSRFVFSSKKFTDLGDHFGVEQGKTTRFEFGASLSGYAKYDIVNNVTLENIVTIYSNYLEKPQNVDVDYTANVIMKVNNYLSANIAFQLIYDDNAVKAVQVREAFGAGITYKF